MTLMQIKQKLSAETERVRQNSPALARTFATMGKDLIQPSAAALNLNGVIHSEPLHRALAFGSSSPELRVTGSNTK